MLLSRVFNVYNDEWPKVVFTWLLRILFSFGFVIGWTVLVATFVTNYGIASLPYLFVGVAIFTIIGSLFYSSVLDHLGRKKIVILNVIGAISLIFLSILFFEKSLIIFVSLMIVNVAVFITQLRLTIDGFIEDLFTALESERVFPVIESAETIGGILGGLVITMFADNFAIESFFYIWIFVFVGVLVLYFSHNHFGVNSSKLLFNLEKKKSVGAWTKIKNEFQEVKKIDYLKGLFLVMFFQWVFFNLLEFQYTKAVYQNISEVVLAAGSGFEHAFIHDLGALFILFSSTTLLVQLFIGSRILTSLGVIGTMIMHVVVSLLSVLALFLNFGFSSAVFAKNNFKMTTSLHNNAFHSAYYAVRENMRPHIREFLNGIVRPLGAVGGTALIILVQRFFPQNNQVIWGLNFTLLVFGGILLYLTLFQRKKYTNVVLDDFLNNKNLEVRLNALDVLSQRGHGQAFPYLSKVFNDQKEAISIKVRILESYQALQDLEAVSDLVKGLNSKHKAIREKALDVLISFKALRNSLNKKQLFLRFNLVSALKKAYEKENDTILIRKIIHLISCFSAFAELEFLIDVLSKPRGKHKFEAILALRDFDDCHLAKLVEKYLDSKNLKYQVAAAIILFKYSDFHHQAMDLISGFLYSEKPKKIALGLYALGELKLTKKKEICLQYLNSENFELQIQAAFALLKMQDESGLACIVEYLFSSKIQDYPEVFALMKELDSKQNSRIRKIIDKLVNEKLNELIERLKVKKINDLDNQSLDKFKFLYGLVGDEKKIELISSFH